jgi:hypothetical protein
MRTESGKTTSWRCRATRVELVGPNVRAVVKATALHYLRRIVPIPSAQRSAYREANVIAEDEGFAQ